MGRNRAWFARTRPEGCKMQQYELSSRDGRTMIRVGRITVPLDGRLRTQLHLPVSISPEDIPKLNMRLRTERHRVDMPSFGIGKDRHKERRNKELREAGIVKLELTGMSIEVGSRNKLKKLLQEMGEGAIVTEIGKDSVKLRFSLKHSDAEKLEKFIEKILAIEGVETKDDFKISLPD